MALFNVAQHPPSVPIAEMYNVVALCARQNIDLKTVKDAVREMERLGKKYAPHLTFAVKNDQDLGECVANQTIWVLITEGLGETIRKLSEADSL